VSRAASTSTLRIVTRGSALALWQAEHVRSALELPTEPLVVRTTGDRVQDVALSRVGDRGLFTREVDDALLDGRADIAVHSAKDIPTTLPDGLEIVAFLEREDPSDVLVARPGLPGRLAELPAGARIGTSSLRRRAQLAALRSDLEIVDLRGNVDTRLARVREGAVDAALLARAGLLRLGRGDAVGERLSPPDWLPAVGQGALALVMRGDHAARPIVASLEHAATRDAVVAERAFLRRLEGGCQVPIGAVTLKSAEGIVLHGGVFTLDGSVQLRDAIGGGAGDAAALGEALAERLIARGADRLLSDARTAGGSAVPDVAAP
jgi:hydroxymethylbilane synthase